MSPKPITINTLFYGDNLPILRDYLPDESVDLIYLDPPFNSNRSYNVLFKDEGGTDSESQITAFEDTWHWAGAVATYHALITEAPVHVSKLIEALHATLGNNQLMAYLVMMTARLVELHRVLKPTGSLYLHCDPTASHYLKIILDTIFGPRNYRSQIVWKRNYTKKGSQYEMTRLANNTDIILFYAKSDRASFRTPKVTLPLEELEKKYDKVDERGRRFKSEPIELPRMMSRENLRFEFMGYTPQYGWMMVRDKLEEMQRQGKVYFTKNGKPRRKNFLDEYQGTEIDNIWGDIFPLGQAQSEALGYPTQKPLALLERIITASSHPGEVVLDPFCGCGTAIIAAQKLGRKWIGIDVTHLSIAVQKYRLQDTCQLVEKQDYIVVGEPEDLGAAQQLAASDRYQFQWWALSLVKAKPVGAPSPAKAGEGRGGGRTGKKGSDKGIDGVMTFVEATGQAQRMMIQVKSGHIKSGDVRDLRGTLEREQAALGLFITLEPPSRDMIDEAAAAGFYHSAWTNQDYPRLQILTIEALLHGAEPKMPPTGITFKPGQKLGKTAERQPGLGM